MDDKKNGKLILLRNMSFESETCAVKNWSWLRGMKPHWGGYCRKWPNGRLQCADLGQLEYDKINKIWKQSVLYRICANCSSTFKALSDISMVFRYQNCSDLLWEKIVVLIEKNFWNSRLKARICKKFEITGTIYSSSERSEQFLVTECFFNWIF